MQRRASVLMPVKRGSRADEDLRALVRGRPEDLVIERRDGAVVVLPGLRVRHRFTWAPGVALYVLTR